MMNRDELVRLLIQRDSSGQAEWYFSGEEWHDLAWKAAAILNDRTFGRISPELEDTILEECIDAVKELTQVLLNTEKLRDNKGVRSETLGGWSRSYASDEENKRAEAAEIEAVLDRHLGLTGLLYRGYDG